MTEPEITIKTMNVQVYVSREQTGSVPVGFFTAQRGAEITDKINGVLRSNPLPILDEAGNWAEMVLRAVGPVHARSHVLDATGQTDLDMIATERVGGGDTYGHVIGVEVWPGR